MKKRILTLAVIFLSGCGGLIGVNGKSEITSIEHHFYPQLHRERRIEISGISCWCLKHIGALFIKGEEPEIASAVKGLKEVRVAQYSTKGLNEKEKRRIASLYTRDLSKKGWETVVKVQDEGDDIRVLALIEEKKINLFVLNFDQNEMIVVKVAFSKDVLEKMKNLIYAKSHQDIENILSLNLK